MRNVPKEYLGKEKKSGRVNSKHIKYALLTLYVVPIFHTV